VVRRSTLVVVFFFLIVGVIIGFNAFLQNRPPLTLTLAADPSAQRWASALVEAFNARGVTLSSGVRVQWRLDATVTDINVWQGRSGWTSDNHPNAWIAGAGWLASNVPSSLPFVRVEPSLAVSPLVWGGFESRVRLLTRDETASRLIGRRCSRRPRRSAGARWARRPIGASSTSASRGRAAAQRG
jgi:hypothetical protein